MKQSCEIKPWKTRVGLSAVLASGHSEVAGHAFVVTGQPNLFTTV